MWIRVIVCIRFFKLFRCFRIDCQTHFALERDKRKNNTRVYRLKKEREREKSVWGNVLITARNGLDRSISFAFKSESKYCPAEKSFLPAGGQCSDGEMQSNRRSTLTRKKRPFQSARAMCTTYNSYNLSSVLFQSKRFSSSGWIMRNRLVTIFEL